MEPGLVAVPEEEAGVDFSWRRALGLADEVEDRHRGRSGAMLHASRLHPLDYPQGREIEQYPSGLSIQRKDSESNRAKSRNRHSIGRGRLMACRVYSSGTPNVRLRLGVVPSSGGTITWMDFHCGGSDDAKSEDEYLARIIWMHRNGLVA
ncbi:hypothetical protein SAY86_000212 [Trapa natans]|uniref:Uncharacterized protein n=1 Tax=Trapa natans TaxID=22666 RepID=A0AAN7RDS2_TRANT|nr:hypothetical protein SAY86_000212 [Trapa natans]